MLHAAASVEAAPFESASELRQSHTHLLEALDQAFGQDASAAAELAAFAALEPRIEEFLKRGEATGAYIEEMRERTACQVLLDYWVSGLAQAGRPVASVRLAIFDGKKLPDLKDKPCPYVGLEAFRDPTFFFGREGDIRTLLAQLQRASLVVVLGASGSGKSSLVMGGVLPALALDTAAGLCAVPPFVPGNAVLEHLARALRQSPCFAGTPFAPQPQALRADSRCLRDSADRGARALVIAIDQFEEVFTLSEPPDRQALVANLAELLNAERGHRVILTMREEFRSRIVELEALSPYLDSAWYSMRPMGYAELRAAVEKPAALVNLQFQSGIVDDLVKKVLGQAAALPLLQFTLRALWEKRDRNRITWEVYRKVGDPLNALTAAADEFYENLARETQDEIKRILLELVRVDELLEAYRQPVPMGRLLQAGRANTQEVLRLLAEGDYVRITSGADGVDEVVEIKHESLVRNWPRFVSWIEEKRHKRRERLALTQAAERWAKSGKPQEGLLTGWQLEAAESATDLLELEKEFIHASIEAVDRVRREKEAALRREADESRAAARRLRLLWIATLGCAAIMVLTVVMAYQHHSKNQQRVLQAMRLQPLNYVNDQLDLALLLGVEVNRMKHVPPELRRALLSALTSSLELKSVLPGHKDSVRTLAFTRNAKLLASGSYDRKIILWDAEHRRMLHPPLAGHTAAVYSVAFSPDEKTLASASADGTVKLWDVATGQLAGTLLHDDEVYGVAIDKDGKLLASSGRDGTVRLWSIESLNLKKVLSHSDPRTQADRDVFALAFRPDGTLLASGGLDGRIVLWDIRGDAKDWRQAGEVLAVKRSIFSVAFSHDGKIIASGNDEGRVDLWDVGARKWLKSPSPNHSSGVDGMAFSPDGRRLATVSMDGTAYIHTLDGSASVRQLKGYAEPFLSVAFAADGIVAAGTKNAMIVFWDIRDFYRFGERLNGTKPGNAHVVFGANENQLISFSRRELIFWQLSPAQRTVPITIDTHNEINFIALAPDRKMLVVVGLNNGVELWDVVRRLKLKTLVAPSKARVIGSVAFGVDNRTLAIGSGSEIWLLNLPSGTIQRRLPSSAPRVTALAFSPDGTRLASAHHWQGMIIWDVATGRPVVESKYGLVDRRLDHQHVNSLAFSPDREVLVSSGLEGVAFWNGKTGEPLGRQLGRHPGEIRLVAVSPDGKLLASGSSNGSVLLWDLEKQEPLSGPISAHSTPVRSIAFSPDGQWLASSGGDGSITRWQLSVNTWMSRACGVVGRNLSEKEWKQFFGEQEYRITCPQVRAYEADALALAGNRPEAEKYFREAQQAALAAEDAQASNSVCWFGSANRFAKLVLPACEKAVRLAPDVVSKIQYQDSRGLARALSGDTAGAIGDFTTVLESINANRLTDAFGSDLIKRREQWIATLKQGRDPFDDATLKFLRTE